MHPNSEKFQVLGLKLDTLIQAQLPMTLIIEMTKRGTCVVCRGSYSAHEWPESKEITGVQLYSCPETLGNKGQATGYRGRLSLEPKPADTDSLNVRVS